MLQEFASALSWETICELGCIPCMVLLKYLTFIYAKKDQFGFRLLIGASEIVSLCAMNVLLMISFEQFILEPGSRVPAILATTCTAAFAFLVHSMNLMGERKRRLTEQQKAELMDL